MQLVMRRQRLTGSPWNKFKITARIVLADDEGSLIDQYLLRQVVLTSGHMWRDLRKAVLISAIIAFLLYPILYLAFKIPIGILLIGFVIVCGIVYHQIREEVRVNDLIVGREFRARSLLDLLEKESSIRKMSDIFAQVVNQARTWHEPEVIDLQPQALSEILEGVRAAT